MSYVRKNLDAYSKERAGRSRLYLLISIKDQVMYLQLCITKRRCKTFTIVAIRNLRTHGKRGRRKKNVGSLTMRDKERIRIRGEKGIFFV